MTDRDEVVARALRSITAPEHRPAFWTELEEAIGAAEPAPAHQRLDTGELPAVTALSEARTARRSRRGPLLAAAAALVVLAGAVTGVLLAGGGDGRDGDLADAPAADLTTAPAEGGEDTGTEPTPSTAMAASTLATAQAPSTPTDAVDTWLAALGEGDPATAAALLGPRTLAYIATLGPDTTPESFMRDSSEGYGAWADSPDRKLSMIEVGAVDALHANLAIVTVSGTWTGEGETRQRYDAIPVVDEGAGWRIEHLAFDSSRETNIPIFTVPIETSGGLVMKPDEDFNVFVPANGTVFFQVDGGDVFVDATSLVGRDPKPFALYNPPADLTLGVHELWVAAIGEDGTIASFGGLVTVSR